MTSYPNLTDDDIDLLKAMPLTAGSMVVTLGNPAFIEAGREMVAGARLVAEAVERFPDSPLIAFLHGRLHDLTNHGEDRTATVKLKTSDPMVAMAAFVDQLDRALNVLDAKVSPADADGYKRWILACAEAAAEAVKEGGVFGIGGKRISEEEAAYLAHLRQRLEVG